MLTIHLETDEQHCTISYLGDGVVYETMWDKVNKVERHGTPHYLKNVAEAQEFMIRNAYALLLMGWRVTTG